MAPDEENRGLPNGNHHVDDSEKPPSGILATSVSQTSQGIFGFLVDTFKPDFLNRRKIVNRRIGQTAWLDGMRGWAAFCVCFHHLNVYSHYGLELCYNATIDAGDHEGTLNSSPITLPFIRLFFVAGHFAVMLFFTISGYVVPRRIVQLLHEGRRDEFLDSVQSAMVRRPIRLYLPVVLSTFLLWNVWHITGIQTAFPEHEPNVFAEFWHWWKETLYFFYFFRIGFLFTIYNAHTWTIPVEFRGSLWLLVWLFAFHTVKTKPRVYLTFGLTSYLIWQGGAWYAAFFSGMLLSELDIMPQGGEPGATRFPWDRLDAWLKSRKVLRAVVLHVMLVFGLFLGSQPSSDMQKMEELFEGCFGWQTLQYGIPSTYPGGWNHYRWFWLFWAASITLYSVKEIHWVRRGFESSFSQYLGKHSFALYLIHGPMIGMLSERLFYLTGFKTPTTDDVKAMFGPYHEGWSGKSWWPFPNGNSGPLGLEPNFLVCVVISIPIFLYVAEVGTRLFDVPSVKAARWVWVKLKAMSM